MLRNLFSELQSLLNSFKNSGAHVSDLLKYLPEQSILFDFDKIEVISDENYYAFVMLHFSVNPESVSYRHYNKCTVKIHLELYLSICVNCIQFGDLCEVLLVHTLR